MDENLPIEAAALLLNAGHDAITVLEQHLGGQPDSCVASVCQQEGRGLVTLDLDFADIRAFPPTEYAGIYRLALAHTREALHPECRPTDASFAFK